MMVMCNATDTIEYGKRTPELSNAILHMKQDTNITKKKTLLVSGI